MSTILELKNICKSFPGVKALDNMQIQLEEGEMHAVCGENGAGKSTLMKVITGVYKADEGDIYLRGEKVTINEPNDAYSKGIAIIFQETSLFKDLNVLENMFMGHEPVKKVGPISQIDYAAMRKKADEIFEFLGISGQIDYDAKIDSLGVAPKQMVEIAKALTYDAKILIFDEPTAALTNKEVRALFRTIARLKEQGMSMMYISHRMEEIFEIADRVTVIRDGSYVQTARIDEVNEQQLIAWMVGRDMGGNLYPKVDVKIGGTMLKVEHLQRTGEHDGFPLHDVSFEVRKGEIFGIAGLAGAGRTEMAECIVGLRKYDSGTITMDGETLHLKDYRDAIKKKLIYVSEDRKKYGLVVPMSIEDNLTLSILYSLTNKGMIDFAKEDEIVDKYMADLTVKAPNREFVVENLSGGNQQKVLVAKALCAEPKILILDEPTRGVDVGAKFEIYRIISDLAAKGLTIIMISSDMPELLGMCDRVMVFKAGVKTGELDRPDFDPNKVLEMAL
ncbi:MAG: sugar ABC transporter ATP-binding protein [Clostridiales bacterium]|nr:sugar ABC transporter ATP-binding protein [Clostridiales bacterium]